MTPSETIKNILQAAVESTGATFFYGTGNEAWLNKLDNNIQLNDTGYVLCEPKGVDELGDFSLWESHQFDLTFEKQDKMGSARLEENNEETLDAMFTIQTDMYNLAVDVFNYVFENNPEIQLKKKNYKYVNHIDNVTTGLVYTIEIIAAKEC